MRIAFAAAALILTTITAFAQTPYAGMQTRPIKALSEQQVADLQAGRGMGLALAAELNGYPGPAHVLRYSYNSNAGRTRIFLGVNENVGSGWPPR
jgi:hypothetical protein